MKILRIIPSMDPAQGGPCQGIRNSIPAQDDLGVYNEVVCFDAPEASFIEEDSFKIHALGPAKGPYSFCGRFASWLRENLHRFDIAIIHGLWQYSSYGAFRVWDELKKKGEQVPRLYVMPHGMLDPYFQRARSRRLKAIRNWFFWKLIEGKVVNGADGILFTCEEELLLARETFRPYLPKAEMNVGYGIQKPPVFEEKFTVEFERKCPAVIDRPYWLFLSRIHPKKGVDLLIKAYLRLKEKFPKVPDLVIAGPGPETSFGQNLQKLADGQSIHFPGMLTGAAKWGAFYGCTAFILPSHQENFGIAVVEAMACSKAVLVSDQVNIWREIQEGGGGLICEDTETSVYTMLEKWFLKSDETQAEMGSKAAMIFHSLYTIEKAAEKMVESLRDGSQIASFEPAEEAISK
ncbi:MAG: glycosyltransferase [Salegentibacter sp.]